MIEVVIPNEINEKYNGALAVRKTRNSNVIGVEKIIQAIDSTSRNRERNSVLLLGEQGAGKTAVVDELIYSKQNAKKPAIVIELSIETLGELPLNTMIGRIKVLLLDMKKVREATEQRNPDKAFQMYLFIDEIHKLYYYGTIDEKSSSALNALKEATGRAEFPLIGATTEEEYRRFISSDGALARRFNPYFVREPLHDVLRTILEARIDLWKREGIYSPPIDDGILDEIITYSDIYVTEQANPAKSLAILEGTRANLETQYENENIVEPINHKTVADYFRATGTEIDYLTTSEDVEREMFAIKGQPLAKKRIMDATNSALYTIRNRKRPLMTIFSVGTTGTGKTETAKALARAFFGSEENMLTINGGDYSSPNDALKVQNIVGDAMTSNKSKLILLDEIEKFHNNVKDGLMRVIDEGLADGENGNNYSIRSTIIMATSNLGAGIFSDIEKKVDLNTMDLPDSPPTFNPELEAKLDHMIEHGMEMTKEMRKEYSYRKAFEKLQNEWYASEASVIKALQDGDPHKDNGIKPEFLERFNIFVPFMPLTRKAIANIARAKLENFQKEMLDKQKIHIQLGKKRTNDEWVRKVAKSKYENVDAVSVMIAEDIVGAEAKTSGARSINRFIEGSVQPLVGNYIAYLKSNGKSVNGYFRLGTNGGAIFENPVHGKAPNVKVTYLMK